MQSVWRTHYSHLHVKTVKTQHLWEPLRELAKGKFLLLTLHLCLSCSADFRWCPCTCSMQDATAGTWNIYLDGGGCSGLHNIYGSDKAKMKHGGKRKEFWAEQCRAKLELSAVKQQFLFPLGIQVHPASARFGDHYLISASTANIWKKFIFLAWLSLYKIYGINLSKLIIKREIALNWCVDPKFAFKSPML